MPGVLSGPARETPFVGKTIDQLLNELPVQNATTAALQVINSLTGETWKNPGNFNDTIRSVTGEDDEDLIRRIGSRAISLYKFADQGYLDAIAIYQNVDKKTTLEYSVPTKSRTNPGQPGYPTLAIGVKATAEMVAFCAINGIPADSISDWKAALSSYQSENFIRMAALVCFDGLIRIGQGFIREVQTLLKMISPADLNSNPCFQRIQHQIPGDLNHKLQTITQAFSSLNDWMVALVAQHGLTREKVIDQLKNAILIPPAVLHDTGDLALYLDSQTNCFEYTGTRTVARHLIEQAVAET